MRIENVIIRSGIICAVTEELPKEPKVIDYGYNGDGGSGFASWYADRSSTNKSRYYKIAFKKYESALQLIKDNAAKTPFKDQDKAWMKLCGPMCVFEHGDTIEYFESVWKMGDSLKTAWKAKIKDDTFYPVSLHVEKMLQVRHGVEWHDLPGQTQGRESDGIYRTVARIVEEPVEQQIKDCFKDIPSGLDKPIKFPKRDSQVEDQEEIIKLIDSYWKFDDNQQPMSSWHDKQDLIEKLRTGKK